MIPLNSVRLLDILTENIDCKCIVKRKMKQEMVGVGLILEVLWYYKDNEVYLCQSCTEDGKSVLLKVKGVT